MRNFIFSLTLIFLATPGWAQDAEPNIWKTWYMTNQPSRYLKFEMGSWEYMVNGHQRFTVKIKNTSLSKVAVTGTLIARTYCGNEIKTTFQFTIKPGQTVGGQPFSADNTTAEVWPDDCKSGQQIPYTDTDASGKPITRHHTDLIRSLRIDDLNVEDLTEKEKEEAAARASAEAAAKARASQNSSGSGNSSGSNGSSQSSSGSASSGNTQSGNASQPASNPPPGSTAMYDAIKAQQDLTDSSMSLVKQGIATGNNTVYFIGLGGLVLAGVTPILLSGSGAGAILGGVFGGAAALTLILSPDDFSRKWFALKTNLGASYEQMPIVMNDKSGTSTDQAAYPMGSFGLKAIFFNNKAVSFSLQPYYSHGVNGIVKEHNATAWQYGFNSTLLMGKSSTAPVRFFLEGGWYNRHLADSNMTTGMAGVLDYSTLRYGLGFMLWTLNKKGTKEFYLKPGIFWERPSFLLTGQPAAVVGNLQLMLASILTIDISYGQNYFIGGTTTHALNTANGVNQNFFSIKLIKSTRLF